MTIYFAIIAGGSLFGALLSWILMLWVKVFVKKVNAAAKEVSSDNSVDNKLTNIPEWIIIALFAIVSGVLAFW